MKIKKLPKLPSKIVTGELRYFIYEMSTDGLIKKPDEHTCFNDANWNWNSGYKSLEDARDDMVGFARDNEFDNCNNFIIVSKVLITRK